MGLFLFSVLVFIYIWWVVTNSNSTPNKDFNRDYSNTNRKPAKKEHIDEIHNTDFNSLIKKAISTQGNLKIKYCDLDGVITIRTISPKVLFRTQNTNELALSSYCHLRGEDRTFMVKRIIEIHSI